MAYQYRVSDAVIRRLPMYYRNLKELERIGVERISSRELGDRMNLTASQIRQDINCFGGFGQQGYGYHVPELRRHIGRILGLDREYFAVIVGAGNIGRAVACYDGFRKEGFHITAIFDSDTDVIGTRLNEIIIQPLEEMEAFIRNNPVDFGIIAVPASSAQKVADDLITCGVRAIWNFAPVDLHLPDDIVSNHVHLTDSLHILTYKMNEEELFKEIDSGRHE